MNSEANYLWHDLLKEGGVIIISPYKKYNGGLSPRDVLAMTHVLSALSRYSPESPILTQQISHLQPDDWDNHLILIGGRLSNQVTKTMTNKETLRHLTGSFSLRKEMLCDLTRLPGRNTLTPNYQDGLERQVQGVKVDYGIISIQPNPMNLRKKVFVIAGIKGWGGIACAQVFSKYRYYKIINQVLEQTFHLTESQIGECKLLEIIVKVEIGHTGPQGTNGIQEISIEMLRLNGNPNTQWENPQHSLNWGSKPPLIPSSKFVSVHLSLSLNHRIALTELNGDVFNIQFSDSTFTTKELDQFEFDVSSALARPEWRMGAKIISERLSKSLPQEFANLLSRLQIAENHPKYSWVRFVTPREYLRAPFEFLRTERDYLVLEYPTFRAISNSFCVRGGLSSILQKESGGQLRILLVAADPVGNILQDVAHEIETISHLFQNFTSFSRIETEIDVIWPDQATFKTIRERLYNTKYHIFHFAGHSTWDSTNPERSGLLLKDESGKKSLLSASQLAAWVKNSELRFCFLNSCEGARNSEIYRLLRYDFLGLSDALIQASVPEVLGFRWAVSSKSALLFAKEFYKSLLFGRSFCTEKAVFEARLRVAEFDREDSTWLSAMLISQK